MPILDIYRLTFRDGLHIGRHGIGQENVLAHIPSDTLFAALTSARAHLLGDAGAWTEKFETNPPLYLTSAFPYAGDVRFYPRPFKPPRIKTAEADKDRSMDPKAWRKVKFVSEEILRHLLKGEIPESYLPPERNGEPQDGLGLQNGAVWLASNEKEKLPKSLLTKKIDGKVEYLNLKAIRRQAVWVERTIPRVTVDRVSSTSEIFHTGRIQFKQGCGLWFGVQWQDDKLRVEMEEVLRFLGDSGLGAERSVGYGAFTFELEKKTLQWEDSAPEGRLYLLSRYYPATDIDAKALLDGAAYDLILVAGRVQTTGTANQRRQSVYLVAEGSIVGGAARGGLAEVSPKVGAFPHKVFRYGFALGIGMEARDE